MRYKIMDIVAEIVFFAEFLEKSGNDAGYFRFFVV